MNPTHYPSLYTSPVTTASIPISYNQYDNNDSPHTQPMAVNQAVQNFQDYQTPQISSPNNFSPQESVMAEYTFFYKTYNDFQIYHITCKEISFYDCLTQNHVQASNLHVFYFQQPDDKKIYQVICEVVSYTFIIRFLNKINYGIELNLSEPQENLDFSREFKENLEFHLKQDLINYLAPTQMNHTSNFDTNLVNTSHSQRNYV